MADADVNPDADEDLDGCNLYVASADVHHQYHGHVVRVLDIAIGVVTKQMSEWTSGRATTCLCHCR